MQSEGPVGRWKLFEPLRSTYNLWFMLQRIFIIFVLALCCQPVWGQRLRGRVVLPDTEELRFDVNNLPLTTLGVSQVGDLNFSPNIVFTLSCQRLMTMLKKRSLPSYRFTLT